MTLNDNLVLVHCPRIPHFDIRTLLVFPLRHNLTLLIRTQANEFYFQSNVHCRIWSYPLNVNFGEITTHAARSVSGTFYIYIYRARSSKTEFY